MRKKLSRLGIFVFYDPQGVVDEYVVHLLQALRPHFQRMVLVSNAKLDSTAKEVLKKNTDDIFVRNNYGMDAAAFKEGLISFCGWEEVSKYDEVILMNDTYFGPIHSLDDMFAEMEKRDMDFWGLSVGYPSVDGWNRLKYGYIPHHIQTFFVAFRRNMVCSEAFKSYWYSYDDSMNDFVSIVTQHEMVMTKHFEDLGFRWDIYAETQKYESKHRSENFNIYFHLAHTMMRDMKFPILKKKTFNVSVPDHLYMNDLETSADALRYIQNETDYDTKLIWDNILRVYNISDIFHSLHLNYVLPSVVVNDVSVADAALVYHVANPFFVERFCKHAENISALIDVYIIPADEKIAELLSQNLRDNDKLTILKPTSQYMEMGGFVLRCTKLSEKYQYLGFVHDQQNPEHYPMTVPESAVYGYLQNIANDPAYITQILHCFETNPRLGVLGAPFPIHHHAFGTYGGEWGAWFVAVKKLAEKMQLHCDISYEKLPFMITGNFWCRTEALRDLWKRVWTADQFYTDPVSKISEMNEVLKRILPYMAQSRRYYSGIVMHTNYASMRITGQQYMLDQIVDVTRRQFGCSGNFYAGYMNQLKAVNVSSPAPSTTATIDASQYGLKLLIRLYLERRTPKWFSDAVFKGYRFMKRLFRKN